MTTPYVVPPLTDAEHALINTINDDPSWNRDRVRKELEAALQLAVEVELATIPIYIYTYYSIDRTAGTSTPDAPDVFPKTDWSRYADEAGALILSVFVEEMLHLSLSSNILHSLGKMPRIYGKSPWPYPAVLPHHARNTGGAADDSRNIPIPLSKFSFEQLGHLLAIEYPAPFDAVPESHDWDTIGQLYSFVRCLISSKYIEDDDFSDAHAREIHATEFSPNSIDTAFPAGVFDYAHPVSAPQPGSAAKVARFASEEDSHLGGSELLQIDSCDAAMEAIATITFQGEGFAQGAYDDASKDELSHYYKFLSLQSKLTGYDQAYIDEGVERTGNNVAPLPEPPAPPKQQYGESELQKFVCNVPDNPVSTNYLDGRGALIDLADSLYQYMLIMTETIFLVPPDRQKIYFNRTMHQSMIWVLDKFLKVLRTIETADGSGVLGASFANIDLGTREQAFATMCAKVSSFEDTYGSQEWYTKAGIDWVVQKIPELPDVSPYWSGNDPAKTPANPPYLESPKGLTGVGTGPADPGPRTSVISSGEYAGVPQWPLHPPSDAELPEGAVRHTCMGLNSCKNQGRTASNACAGQGYCSTALAYQATDPGTPSLSDHTCHVLNDCRNQGGCGLYGTAEEFTEPGHNACQSKGSCATPINAERFITDGPLRGQSVWVQARMVFTERVWPGLRENDPQLPAEPPAIAGPDGDPELFQYGPTIGWIEADNDGMGMTSCGSSGMSGAGSCS